MKKLLLVATVFAPLVLTGLPASAHGPGHAGYYQAHYAPRAVYHYLNPFGHFGWRHRHYRHRGYWRHGLNPRYGHYGPRRGHRYYRDGDRRRGDGGGSGGGRGSRRGH